MKKSTVKKNIYPVGKTVHKAAQNFGLQNEEFETTMAKTIPLGRPQSTEDMGEAVLYLACAENVSGVALNVSGGMQMN